MPIKIPRKENKNIEFKERLTVDYHLKEDIKQHLASQMNFLLEKGHGTAVYILGVKDSGEIAGLTDIELEETLNVLNVVAKECGAEIFKVEKFTENGKTIAKIVITKSQEKRILHLIIGVCGHVNHGKSTLIGCLLKGKPDKKAYLYLDVLPHEIERGLSAEIHHAFLGFKESKPLFFRNPLDKKEKERIMKEADKIISFVDTVGHEPWLRTTIRGLIGQSIDYGLLVIAADDGPTHISKEHLGILLAAGIPVIVVITKIDKVSTKKVKEAIESLEVLLKKVGRVPYKIESKKDIGVVLDKLEVIVPILKVSSITYEGFDILLEFLRVLPERPKSTDKPFLMYIDKVYNVTGAGTVVSGTIKQGKLKSGQKLLIGPEKLGKFRSVKTKSIEMHYFRLKEAKAGFVVGISIKGIKSSDIERGMILCDESLKPRAVKEFEAEIYVLSHPTKIKTGYEPVFHCHTISQTVKVYLIDKKYLKAGEYGKVKMKFKYRPQYIKEGDKFIFREGKTKGIGVVKKIISYA
ncbi:MAG: GTP-binding protein [Candidatus Aenigmarchaeota archaeon]|nr:GTP-binding protein [Candidatus Aenigmarchaeota archaeon]